MVESQEVETAALTVRAVNGVVWTRLPGGRSSPADIRAQLVDMCKGHVEREWDWWQEDRCEQEAGRRHAVLAEWDNGAPSLPEGMDPQAWAKAYCEELDRDMEIERRRRADLAAEHYAEPRASMRLEMMRAQAEATFSPTFLIGRQPGAARPSRAPRHSAAGHR